jgi:tetratricopeptide (TPR) repeat protein
MRRDLTILVGAGERIALDLVIEGDPDTALAILDRGRRTSASEHVRGMALAVLGRVSEAAEALERSLRLIAAANPAQYFDLGCWRYELRDYHRAARAWHACLELLGDDQPDLYADTVRLLYAIACLQIRQFETARTELARLGRDVAYFIGGESWSSARLAGELAQH